MRRAYASSICAGMSVGIVRGLMHGRTDERTYVDHQSPSLRNPLSGDARAHIREMAVDKSGGNA